jgi:hypothetical protein
MKMMIEGEECWILQHAYGYNVRGYKKKRTKESPLKLINAITNSTDSML